MSEDILAAESVNIPVWEQHSDFTTTILPSDLEPWNHGTMEPWNHGTMEPWNYDQLWSHLTKDQGTMAAY